MPRRSQPGAAGVPGRGGIVLNTPEDTPLSPWRAKLHEIIYEADTPAGRAFDIGLIICIGASVIAVMLESVTELDPLLLVALRRVEWLVTGLFTVEYVLRLIIVRRPLRFVFSFFGLVDLLAILPTYLGLFLTASQTHDLLVIRGLRILRIFRLFKLVQFVGEASALRQALVASRYKIIVFMVVVLNLALINGAIMYLVEGPEHPFTSIPQSMYWAIVTMTTVGYGDMAPSTDWGRAIAAVTMILGYAIIAVPTGIISVEIANVGRAITTQACPSCSHEGHDPDALHCKYCGVLLNPQAEDSNTG